MHCWLFSPSTTIFPATSFPCRPFFGSPQQLSTLCHGWCIRATGTQCIPHQKLLHLQKQMQNSTVLQSIANLNPTISLSVNWLVCHKTVKTCQFWPKWKLSRQISSSYFRLQGPRQSPGTLSVFSVNVFLYGLLIFLVAKMVKYIIFVLKNFLYSNLSQKSWTLQCSRSPKFCSAWRKNQQLVATCDILLNTSVQCLPIINSLSTGREVGWLAMVGGVGSDADELHNLPRATLTLHPRCPPTPTPTPTSTTTTTTTTTKMSYS